MFIQSRIVSSESHNIIRRTLDVSSRNRTSRWIGHSRSFKFILIGVSSNPERVIDCHNVQQFRGYFRNLQRYRENCKFVDFNHPTLVWRQSSEKLFRIRNILHCQKLESLTYISAADSTGLHLLLITQLFLKVKRSESRSARRKRILTWDSHSRSF